MKKKLTQLEKDVFAAAVLGTSSTKHEWRHAPCQYKEINEMVFRAEYGSNERIAIWKSFNENRAMQLDKECTFKFE